jgi:hypothetical protein
MFLEMRDQRVGRIGAEGVIRRSRLRLNSNMCYSESHVELSSRVRSGRVLVLYGQPVGTAENPRP